MPNRAPVVHENLSVVGLASIFKPPPNSSGEPDCVDCEFAVPMTRQMTFESRITESNTVIELNNMAGCPSDALIAISSCVESNQPAWLFEARMRWQRQSTRHDCRQQRADRRQADFIAACYATCLIDKSSNLDEGDTLRPEHPSAEGCVRSCVRFSSQCTFPLVRIGWTSHFDQNQIAKWGACGRCKIFLKE